MNEVEKILIRKDIIEEIFKIADMNLPNNVSDEELFEAVLKIKNIVDENNSKDTLSNFNPTSNNILVVDDIGVVTYQLKNILSKLGYNVYTAKDIFSGLNSFIKTNYAYLIMDLFVSTEQEGYMLLKETKKIITKNNLDTKIIVITASSKAENKVKCLNGGADVFLKKETGWQDKLCELVENFNSGNLEDLQL